jgi:hypothetical protein
MKKKHITKEYKKGPCRRRIKHVRELAPEEQLFLPLQEFAEKVTAKFSSLGSGEPEDQLRAPVEKLFSSFGEIISREIVLTGEPLLRDRLGKPDFAVYDGQVLIGYIEVKAPGKGTNPELFKGHDRDQWCRFKSMPNLIYADGNEWSLYRSGELFKKRVRLSGDIRTESRSAVEENNAISLFQLFAEFLSWTPIVPLKPKELAGFLAPYCWLIREEVLDGLNAGKSPLKSLREEIKKLLFPDATDQQFADAYAQTIIFALLLSHLEGANVLDLMSAYKTLESQHLLLSRSLQFLTDPLVLKEISSSVPLAQRVIHEIPLEVMKSASLEEEPWLFFYEHFLAKYDPKLRKSWGVYYTPVEVVCCQVRLIDEVLTRYLGKDMGFVEPGVITLDPALGTGTYLLGIVDHALKRVEIEEGPGAVKGGARSLTHNLHGFEWMVGPYAVAQLRFATALTSRGVKLPPAGIGIYLTNTLESPHVKPPAPPLFHRPIALEHERALKVKDAEQVLVCLGNPPYGRHEAADEENRAITGGWVRYGDKNEPAILEDFIEPARKAGHGVHLKNLYNQYVYFIRWALWKVFEHKTATGPGIVSFITASSYLEGDAFSGLREHMRRICDHIDIIDLGGEGRGTRKDENIFAIKTPIAVFVAWRKERKKDNTPATVRYTRIEGDREEKLKILGGIKSSGTLSWFNVPSEWQAAFRPAVSGEFATWPNITDLFPWQSNGVQVKRTWPVGPSREVLLLRWEKLLRSSDRAQAMRESGDRTIDLEQMDLFDQKTLLPTIRSLKDDEACRSIVRYGYRSFDRQFLLADNRLISRPRPSLWQAHSDRQVYFVSLFSIALGAGPALVCSAEIPDLDFFRGSYGAKAAMPFYRESTAREPNVLPGLLEFLSGQFDHIVTPDDLAGYIYALLAQPEYTSRFEKELESRQVRVPLTKDLSLFFKASEFGKPLIWLHTYGERMASDNRPQGKVPQGKARCLQAVSDAEESYPNDFCYDEYRRILQVGDGRFGPVDKKVYEFEVSGLKVLKSWLGYRMRERSGRKSSPLDDIGPKTWTHEFTRELLELLWILDKTIEGYVEQKKILDAVLASPLFRADDLPPVPESARKGPKIYERGELDFSK